MGGQSESIQMTVLDQGAGQHSEAPQGVGVLRWQKRRGNTIVQEDKVLEELQKHQMEIMMVNHQSYISPDGAVYRFCVYYDRSRPANRTPAALQYMGQSESIQMTVLDQGAGQHSEAPQGVGVLRWELKRRGNTMVLEDKVLEELQKHQMEIMMVNHQSYISPDGAVYRFYVYYDRSRPANRTPAALQYIQDLAARAQVEAREADTCCAIL